MPNERLRVPLPARHSSFIVEDDVAASITSPDTAYIVPVEPSIADDAEA